MMRFAWARFTSALLLALACPQVAFSAPRVTFELVTEAGFPLGGEQRWIRVLSGLDQSGIRVRAGRPGDKIDITNRGTEAFPSYHVVGILSATNKLELTGAVFSLRDGAKIAQWTEQLREGGVDGLTAERVAFGLTPDQLVSFHDALAKPIAFKTKGVRAGDVARKIVSSLNVPFSVEAQARRAFSRNEAVLDELSGLSTGTSLAATLRPLGLVMSPRKAAGGQIELLISDVREVEESWPIGWPPQEPAHKAAAELYERLPAAEIADRPLSEALEAIGGRLETPFLFDHNGMARQQIDPAAKNVTFKRKERVAYLRVLDNVLFQARLKSEVRLDEAGRPFLWISPRG